MATPQDRPMGQPFDKGRDQGNVGTTAQGIQEKAAGVMGTVKETAQNVASSVSDYASQAKDKVQDLASDAADSMGHAKHQVMDFGATAYDQTGDTMKAALDQMTGMIRQHPIPALLVGFGVGFVLAQMIDRE